MEQIHAPERQTEKARPNRTGIPGRMKRDFERRSGLAFDDVRVHYNSNGPARLGALAYTRGTQVYLGPGQERYLPHELGHVVQQKTRPVPATRTGGGAPINDDPALEAEADRWSAGADMGGPVAQLYRGQDVVQCIGERLAKDKNKDQLDEIYGYAVGKMPDLDTWEELGCFEDKTIDGWLGCITLGGIAASVNAFKDDPSPDRWRQLKGLMAATAQVDCGQFEKLWGKPKGTELFAKLAELREVCVRTEQVVESLWVYQKNGGAYRGLLQDISVAKQQVLAAVRLVQDLSYYDAYFLPRAYWRVMEGNHLKAPPPKTEQQSADRIRAPVAVSPPAPDQIPGDGDDWEAEDFASGRRTLLKRQALTPKPDDTPKKWYELQAKRKDDPQTNFEGEEELQSGMPYRWGRLTEALFGRCCEMKTAEIKYRYGLILKGLNWLLQDPYLKVMFYPEHSNTLGQTMHLSEERAVIELWGAYMSQYTASDERKRPCTLIHEISHAFAGTTDHLYGEDIKTLDEGQALENAETYAFAAMNRFDVSCNTSYIREKFTTPLSDVPMVSV